MSGGQCFSTARELTALGSSIPDKRLTHILLALAAALAGNWPHWIGTWSPMRWSTVPNLCV
jgi:hypothetical protein